MSGKERIEQVCKVLEAEKRKMQDQVIYLNGQILYNQKMQEILNQQLHELTDEEEAAIAKINKSNTKPPRKSRNK